MKRADAAIQLRKWFAEHASAVDSTLRRFGVSDKEDRANLTQEVLLTGFRALVRGDVIENPVILLDRARSALHAGSARAALALLAQHASRFPDESNAKFYQELLQRVCAAPAARGATECASQPLSARAPGR